MGMEAARLLLERALEAARADQRRVDRRRARGEREQPRRQRAAEVHAHRDADARAGGGGGERGARIAREEVELLEAQVGARLRRCWHRWRRGRGRGQQGGGRVGGGGEGRGGDGGGTEGTWQWPSCMSPLASSITTCAPGGGRAEVRRGAGGGLVEGARRPGLRARELEREDERGHALAAAHVEQRHPLAAVALGPAEIPQRGTHLDRV